jgi:beta-phosphoglucomutase
MPPFDAILFDFDGVLADTEPLHWACWSDALAPLGISFTWDYYREHCIGVDDRDMLKKLASQYDPPRHWQDLWARYPVKTETFRARSLAAPPFDPGLDEWLRGLHQRYRLAVVSSSSRTEIDPLLVAEGLREHFDATVYAEDVPKEKLKPAPDPYLLAAMRTGAHHPLVIEDSVAGQQSGRAAGFEVLALNHAAQLRLRLENYLQSRAFAHRGGAV